MANNLKKFQTEAEYTAATLNYPSVAWVTDTDTVHFDKSATTRKYRLTLNDGSVVNVECDGTSEITSGEVASQYSGTVVSAEIGDCVTNIGEMAFYNCSSLTSVDIPNSVTSIGSQAFNNTPWWNAYSADTSHHYGNIVYINDVAYMAVNRSVTSVTFKADTKGIGSSAFNNCSGLTSVDIPNSVTSIGNQAFFYCSGLTSVDIPNSVTSIGSGAFRNCTSLTSCTIGSGVTSIGSGAFKNCSSLTSITVNAQNPPTLENNAFDGSTCPIYVPSGSVEIFKTTSGWSTYASRIQAIA